MWSCRRAVAAAIVGLLFGGACNEQAQAPAVADGRPVLASVSGEPGTELRDGFEVADGSTLIGDVFPDGMLHGEPAASGSEWWAVLFVSGEPSTVLDAYLAQAEAIGMTRVQVPEGGPEFLREDLPPDAQQYTECGVAAEGGPSGYSCSGLAVADGGAPCLHATLIRRPVEDTMESTLQLRYVTDPRGCVAAGAHMIGDPTAEIPPLLDEWPAPPSPGESLGAAFPLLAGIEVARGSALAAPPLSADGCVDGTSVIVAITEDPLRVFDTYVAQLDDLAPHAERSDVIDQVMADGSTLHEVVRVESGGGNRYWGRLLEREDAPSVLVLSACSG